MTNKEFIAELAQRTGYSPEDTQRMVNLLMETMGDRFQEDDTVLVPTQRRLPYDFYKAVTSAHENRIDVNWKERVKNGGND